MPYTGRVSIEKLERQCLLFLFYYTLVIQGLMSLLGLPQIVLYVKDIILVLCIVLNLYEHNIKIKRRGYLQLIVYSLLAISVVSAFIGKVPMFTYIVAMRKFFRGFLYMVLCMEYLNTQDIDYVVENCYKIQIINFLLIVYQRFGIGLGQDHSNGIFGTGYTNNYLSILCIILVCYCTAQFYYRQCTLKKWIFQLAINFGIAVVAELKVLFILLPVSIILILREKLFSGRGMKLSLFLVMGLVVALIFFGIMYPDQLSAIISISGMKNYNNWGLTTHAIVDRKNWLPYTVNNIFQSSIIKNILGVGFGTVSGLSSATLDAYGYRELGYGSYTASMLFLETGFVGLILVAVWFALEFRKTFIRHADNTRRMLADFEKGFILSMIVFLVYANILYNDSAYMVFFALSFMYLKTVSDQKERGK